ncbi:UPF0382 membrane protein YwdK [Desulfuromonas versatilis]|uniref:UPF0382 membrane protein YwdK n=1 Tax=Desulfuromonas versatilis TaxID=2802975 RepID=A0ABN6DUH5_9BACT|nr:DUF423 domain-containing protein [Desulfuromonas versatilis]BCR03770.1 UPF0382 membrane protein YwdK [Desulfuromonas versatilis]
MIKLFVAIGAGNAFLAVALGAFGAHILKARLAADMFAIWQTAVQYHLPHAVGLVVVGILIHLLPGNAMLNWAGWLLVVGMLLFSGSLYLLALSGLRWLGAITPLGGVALLGAWAALVGAVLGAKY